MPTTKKNLKNQATIVKTAHFKNHPPHKHHRKTGANKPRLAELATIKEGFAKSFDGTSIWYQAQGKGVPMIFCNGLGCSTFYWKHIHSYFKKSNKVILFDWRGHGQSATPRNEINISIDALTEDLYYVLKELKITKAILLGHSMGIQILFRFYEKYPKMIKALIPCFGTYGNPLDTFYNSSSSKYIFKAIYTFNHLFPKLANGFGYLMSKNPLWFQMGSMLKMMNPGLVDRKVLKEYIEHFTSVDPVFLAKLALSMQEYNAEPTLKNINVPVLIFAAEQDTFTPVWLSKKMHHLIPKSELMVIKNSTHVALVEQPALINLRIEKFIKEHF